jgi:hypothetical protein
MSVNVVSLLEHNRTFMRFAPSHSFRSKLGGGPSYTCNLCESDEDAVGAGAVRKREGGGSACAASACRGLQCCLV